MPYWELFAVVAPVIAMIAVGSGVRASHLLTKEADTTLLRLVVYVLYPALIFSTCATHPGASDLRNLTWAPALGFITIVFGFLVAAAVMRFWPGIPAPKARTFIFTVGIFNYGYIPVPLVKHFFPDELGVLFIFNLGVDVAIWTLGIAILSGGEGRMAWNRLLNPSIVAVIAGLSVNVLGIWKFFPAFISTSLEMLATCCVPLALMMIGASLLDEVRGGDMRSDWRLGVASCILRLGVLPGAFLLAAKLLPLDEGLKKIMIVQASMPAAVLPIVLARHYRGDARTAIWVVVATTALGLFLIPFWIGAGMRWLNLS
jgi:malate permease and related proteins